MTEFVLADDFTLAGRPNSGVVMPFTGQVLFEATIQKTAVTTDDLKLVLEHNGIPVPGSEIIIAADSLYPVLRAAQDKTAIRQVIITGYGDLLPGSARAHAANGAAGDGATAAAPITVPAELLAPRQMPAGAIDLMTIIAGSPASAL